MPHQLGGLAALGPIEKDELYKTAWKDYVPS